jgi:hypothetical protein
MSFPKSPRTSAPGAFSLILAHREHFLGQMERSIIKKGSNLASAFAGVFLEYQPKSSQTLLAR